jgi:hypothetical protein
MLYIVAIIMTSAVAPTAVAAARLLDAASLALIARFVLALCLTMMVSAIYALHTYIDAQTLHRSVYNALVG